MQSVAKDCSRSHRKLSLRVMVRAAPASPTKATERNDARGRNGLRLCSCRCSLRFRGTLAVSGTVDLISWLEGLARTRRRCAQRLLVHKSIVLAFQAQTITLRFQNDAQSHEIRK